MGEYQCCWNQCFLKTWRWHKHQKHSQILGSSTAFIRGLSAFDRGERLHSSFGSWFEGLDWLLPAARATWRSKNCEHLCMVSDLREADFFFTDIENISNVYLIGSISGGVGMFLPHVFPHFWFVSLDLTLRDSEKWNFPEELPVGFLSAEWGNIPGAMIPRRTLQTLLLVSTHELLISLNVEETGCSRHFAFTIALVGWDISMPSSEILSNSKSFIGLYNIFAL